MNDSTSGSTILPSLYFGIDPGAGGGLAAISGSPEFSESIAMPGTNAEVYDWLWQRRYNGASPMTYAVLERVTGFIPSSNPGHAHGGQPGSRMFTFGASYGALQMALVALNLVEDVTFWLVSPQTWQKALAVSFRDKAAGETQPQRKGRLKERACELFPSEKPTLKTCDALLLAHYCMMKVNGEV